MQIIIMSSIIHINCSVMTVMLAFLLLAASAPTMANPYHETPSDSYSKVPAEASNEYPETPKGSGLTCQGENAICPGGGAQYRCCDGLVCTPRVVGTSFCRKPIVPGEEKTPQHDGCRETTESCLSYDGYECCEGLTCILPNNIGFGFCFPMGGRKTESPKEKCQGHYQFCEPYGKHQCCNQEAYTCVDTRTLPFTFLFNLLNVDPKKLPPGIGLCIPIKI